MKNVDMELCQECELVLVNLNPNGSVKALRWLRLETLFLSFLFLLAVNVTSRPILRVLEENVINRTLLRLVQWWWLSLIFSLLTTLCCSGKENSFRILNLCLRFFEAMFGLKTRPSVKFCKSIVIMRN